MKKLLLLAVLLTAPLTIFSQEETPKDTVPNGWTRAGNISLLFNQAAFNHEWTGGGTSNYSGNLSLTYDFNYKHDKISWNNRLTGEYGITKNKDDKYSRKTNDRLEFNSILGQQIKESNWYKSLFLNCISVIIPNQWNISYICWNLTLKLWIYFHFQYILQTKNPVFYTIKSSVIKKGSSVINVAVMRITGSKTKLRINANPVMHDRPCVAVR